MRLVRSNLWGAFYALLSLDVILMLSENMVLLVIITQWLIRTSLFITYVCSHCPSPKAVHHRDTSTGSLPLWKNTLHMLAYTHSQHISLQTTLHSGLQLSTFTVPIQWSLPPWQRPIAPPSSHVTIVHILCSMAEPPAQDRDVFLVSQTGTLNINIPLLFISQSWYLYTTQILCLSSLKFSTVLTLDTAFFWLWSIRKSV